MSDPQRTAEKLVSQIKSYEQCLVAFSGGVDSAVVAKAAQLALGDSATAITAVSPSLATGELEEARSVAAAIGIRHQTLRTDEFSNPAYVQNAPDRCYHCKTELYDQMDLLKQKFPNATIINGTNTDDTGDYRPGLTAAAEHHVRSPLVECDINKATVRELAAFWQLPVWNKPAMPCLSSRIAYGEEVTAGRLRMIDQAEQFLSERGFVELRVRYHKGDLARVEVSESELPRLIQEPLRSELTAYFEELGFKFVSIDLNGFRSGNLNTLVPLELLKQNQ